jgi:phage shock protein C
MNRRLYRCTHDRRIAGVAAGVAEYLDIDPTVVRVLWVLSIFFGGVGLLLYIVMMFIVPPEPEGFVGESEGADATGAPAAGVPHREPASVPHRHAGRTSGDGTGGSGIGMTFLGAVLILFGALALLDPLLPAWADHGRFLWPAFILGIGVLFVLTATRRRSDQR